ncbi:MAG: glycosyltransferase [Chloroflexota bacterium]
MANCQLRIAMLSTHSCPIGPLGAKDTGGMSVYVREVACELGKQGHLVDIYTRVHDVAENEITELGQNVRLIHLKAGGGKDLRKIAMHTYIPEFARNLEDFRKRNNLRYDIIFSHYWLSGCAGEYLKNWWHVPQMIMFHTLGAMKIAIGEKESRLRLESEKRLIGNCERVIAPTEREKGNLISYYGASEETIRIIPCGVNQNLFQPLPRTWAKEQLGQTGNKVILFVGRIEPLKGIGRLIQAVALLPNRSAVKLLVVGGDEESKPEMERLIRLAKKLRIQDSVIFTGRVKQTSLPLYYSAADVAVISSHYESFGLVALEALACGTRVVTTDVGDLKNIIIQEVTGYVLAEKTPQAMAVKIAMALSQTDTGGGSAALMRASVNRFNWTMIAGKIGQECRELTSSSRPDDISLSTSRTTNCCSQS